MTQTSAVASGPRGERPRPSPYAVGRRELRWPAVVAAVYTVLQLVLVVPGSGLGWDETVYVSQVSPQAPAAFFSAPRARGITFLVAPVAVLTSSVEALRVWLALLSGAGLLVSMRVWLRLLPAGVPALAGALFAGLWITLLYGSQAMPNLWVAYGAMISVGCFLRAARDPSDRLAPVGLGGGVALVALMRPGDAFWLVLPLALAAAAVRAWRRPALFLVLAAGAVLGSAEWIIEAYVRYGGLFPRLARASEIQGHLGWNPAFGDHARALAGRTLCRPCDVPLRRPLVALWWFLLPLLVGGGILAAVRERRRAAAARAPVVLAALTGLCLAAPYLFLVGYAAPRFLLPAYALLSLPAAVCLAWLARTARPRPLAAGVLALGLVAHLGVQYLILDGAASRSRRNRTAFGAVAAELGRLGVRPPCLLTGEEAVRIAFRAGCASRQAGGHDASITPAGLTAAARSRPVAVLVRGSAPPPGYAAGWRRHTLPGLPGTAELVAYLGPATRPGAP